MISPDGTPVEVDLARTLAESAGVCVRPLLRKVTDRVTGEVTRVPIPCGSTREVVCGPCAVKARRLRMHQCAEGWHLRTDPQPSEAGDELDQAEEADDDQHDDDIGDGGAGGRRCRSTRRRQDASDLPRVPMEERTTGKAFTSPDGKTYVPSMFLTLTLPSYGKVIPGVGVPVDPGRYDYRRAALDAMHFPKLVDRFWQNLRRCAGYNVQYFAAVETQRRLAPHLHAAIRGAIPRATLKAVAKATYHQVWWPRFDQVVYVDNVPVWDREVGRYLDPDTGVPLRSWGEALDDLDGDPDAQPAHVLRLGPQIDIKGLLGGTADADRSVRYLCKYVTKAVADTYTEPDRDGDDSVTVAYQAHIDRLHAEVRWLPCSPTCGNWLRYGIEPDDPGPGLVPGSCPGPGHDRANLGLGGRRVLVSRAWTGKTLTVHRADRATVVREVLQAAGIDPPEARRCAADVLTADGLPRFVWEDVPVEQRDYAATILTAVRQARAWRDEYDQAKTMARAGVAAGASPRAGPVHQRSATVSPVGRLPVVAGRRA